MKKIIKRILFHILYPLSKIYLSKEKSYTYNDISVEVLPCVFHPGLISIFAAKQNANVTASDINSTAIKNIKLNAEKNKVELNIIQSDLFDSIPSQNFDYIIINPPYFPKEPKDENEQAWFCGSDFRFFKNLFKQIDNYICDSTNVIMILSEDCEIERIKSIAKENSFVLNEIQKTKVWNEWNYLFKVIKND